MAAHSPNQYRNESKGTIDPNPIPNMAAHSQNPYRNQSKGTIGAIPIPNKAATAKFPIGIHSVLLRRWVTRESIDE